MKYTITPENLRLMAVRHSQDDPTALTPFAAFLDILGFSFDEECKDSIAFSAGTYSPVALPDDKEIPLSLALLDMSYTEWAPGAVLNRLIAHDSRWYHACLREVLLQHALFTGADISSADFAHTDLSEANLTQLKDANDGSFFQAKLLGARLSGTTYTSWNFQGADLTQAVVKGCVFHNCNFKDANLTNARFISCEISSSCDFLGTKQQGLQLFACEDRAGQPVNELVPKL